MVHIGESVSMSTDARRSQRIKKNFPMLDDGTDTIVTLGDLAIFTVNVCRTQYRSSYVILKKVCYSLLVPVL